jgi:hypothetical protein
MMVHASTLQPICDMSLVHSIPDNLEMLRSPLVLDPVQLARIEAVHRGFLYQHLFAVACLLMASGTRASAIIVEADEDVCRFLCIADRHSN